MLSLKEKRSYFFVKTGFIVNSKLSSHSYPANEITFLFSCLMYTFFNKYSFSLFSFNSTGTKPEHFAKVAWKNHKHSKNNP